LPAAISSLFASGEAGAFPLSAGETHGDRTAQPTTNTISTPESNRNVADFGRIIEGC
jgi:hypothetical protein